MAQCLGAIDKLMAAGHWDSLTMPARYSEDQAPTVTADVAVTLIRLKKDWQLHRSARTSDLSPSSR